MWADNETEDDYLGFGDLVDEIVVALTEARLLPLTVGVYGDWGSGKSSVLRMVRKEIDGLDKGDREILSAWFNPWQHESYAEIKAAFIDTVLNGLAGSVPDPTRLERLRAFVKRLSPRTIGRYFASVAPVVATGVTAAVDPAAGSSVGVSRW